MNPTGVDLKVVRERLAHVERSLEDANSLPADTLEVFLADRRNALAAESSLRRGLEALFDTARHLLAKGHGKASLEYRQVARLAVEHGLVPPGELGERLLRMAGFRNRLVHHYDEVTPEELHRVVTRHLGDLEAVAEELERAARRLARGDGDSPGGE